MMPRPGRAAQKRNAKKRVGTLLPQSEPSIQVDTEHKLMTIDQPLLDAKALSSATSYAVYVPQGRSAILNRVVTGRVDGLYTNKFSSCNIIVAMGHQKVVMIHADQQAIFNFLQIRQELDRVGEVGERTIHVYFRPKVGERIKNYIFAQLKLDKLVECPVADVEDGVQVSLLLNPDSDIRKCGAATCGREVLPPALIHHPDEKYLLSVRKIEQLIGLRAKNAGRDKASRHLTLFDGDSWERLPEDEFKINSRDMLTREEMALFKPTDNFFDICDQESKITVLLKKASIPMESGTLVTDVFPHLEAYLSHYDAAAIFKRNLSAFLDSENAISIYGFVEGDRSSGSSILSEEKEIFQRILEQVRSQESTINMITRLVSEYKKFSETSCKEVFFLQYDLIFESYKKYQFYSEMANFYVEEMGQANLIYDKAYSEYGKAAYPAAINLFKEYISKAALFLTSPKENKCFAEAYFYLGMSYMKIQKYQLAETALEKNRVLFTDYVRPLLAPELERVKCALANCRKHLLATQESRLLFS